MEQDPVKAELDARRRPGAVVQRLSSLGQLAARFAGRGMPPSVRAVVQGAFATQGHLRPSVIQKERDELGQVFSDFGRDDWKRAIAVLLPGVASSAEAAIESLGNRPYQTGIARRPFRCPRAPALRGWIRGNWLLNTTLLLGEYEADICWVAEHGAHLAGWWGAVDLGWLLAGAIDAGGTTGQRVQDILVAIASGELGNERMGRHVTQALLSCSKPDAWEFVEKLLLAAQRQEGLRQAILESIDEAHPQAFRRMVRLILAENLTRFSSVVRAADTWFGFLWDGSSGVKIQSLLERVSLFLEEPSARTAALREPDGETVFLALWSIAFDDVQSAIDPARALLDSPLVPVRFAATHFLIESLWTSGIPPLADKLADPDLSVAVRALDMFSIDRTASVDGGRLFGLIERLLQRVPKRSQSVDSPIWPWGKRRIERSTIVATLAANASAVKSERLLPYIPDLAPAGRAAFVRRAAGLGDPWDSRLIARPRKPSPAERAVILELLGDPSPDVRTAAFQALEATPVQADELERLVSLLGRTAGDLRNRALKRLSILPDADFLTTADRLLNDAEELRRLAGLELLRQAGEAKRLTSKVNVRMEQYAAQHSDLTVREEAQISSTLRPTAAPTTRDDALGLLDRSALWVWPEPRARNVQLDTRGARASLESLAELIIRNQESEHRAPDGEMRQLVDSTGWSFGPRKPEDREKDAVPLASVWKSWLRERSADLRDRDDCELLRALVADGANSIWSSGAPKRVSGLGQHSAGAQFLRAMCAWCVAWDPPLMGADFLLDGLENEIAGFSSADYREMAGEKASGQVTPWRWGQQQHPRRMRLVRADTWLRHFRWWRELLPALVQPAQAVRLYGLLRAFQARAKGYDALGITLDDFLPAYATGTATQADFLDLLAGSSGQQSWHSILRAASLRTPPRGVAERPELLELVDRFRRRVVEVESQRGDRETAASGLALELRWTGGLETLAHAIPALGNTHFARRFGWSVSGASRQDTLSHLVVRSLPRAEDTPEAFARWAEESEIGEGRLIELAVYAPQWAGHVNQILRWPGLEDAVWWIQAHTKDDRSWQLQEMKEVWAAEVSERTALSAADLTEGAVDVAWFTRVYEELGRDRWKNIDQAAKYAASSGGHTRAQLFARAMAGLLTREELQARIDGKRHQDSVRALGLLPLPSGAARESELLDRFKRLAEFKRQSRQFGSLRQQSEKRAVAIGMANLARTAGYRDPQRLQWAMEQRAVADLAAGPLVVSRGDVTLTLSISDDGDPSLSTTRNGKPLKTLPASLKKDGEVEEVKGRLQELKRQRSRVRDTLEEAMCRGDRFAPGELRTLLGHPILAPGLSRLVFVGDGVGGYLADGGRSLRDHAGKTHVLGDNEEVRLAHPEDLLRRGDWSAWQRECYKAERVQPFKQLFRELYPMTETERGKQGSSRYAGHQVNPRQALALLGGRGWVSHPEEGVSRTFHDEGLTARLTFQEPFFTPADIDGLTLEEVVFTKKGLWTALDLDKIPARLFSETMRDLDLVTSVAHRGGVDPEATASTVEMRAALVRETCELLGLSNVELLGHHAIVQGSLARYSIHLGSAGVMVLPGSAIPIVAVHSQYRGRLFLPFADHDPRSAEVLSKVLLLARDTEIRDPNILDWIRAAK